jgi:hypothetical protein
MLTFLTQIIDCTAQPVQPVQIVKSIPIDNYGKTNFFLNRGFKTDVMVELDVQYSGSYLIVASLYDANNVPVSTSTKNVDLSNGKNKVTLNLNITNYAFIGLANLHVAILYSDHTSITSQDVTVAIQILGDFDKNSEVSASDIAFFILGYCKYWDNQVIAPEYQKCDITEDNAINTNDITAFVIAYQAYWNTNKS